MSSKLPDDEARGEFLPFWRVFVFPQIAKGQDLRTLYVDLLDQWSWTHSNESRVFEEYAWVTRKTEEARFLTGANGSLIINAFGLGPGYISSALDTVVLSFGASQEGEMWTYNLLRKGHLIDRHATWPRWIPESIIGDPDFDEAASVIGREEAETDYLSTWKGDENQIAEIFSVSPEDVRPYLKQFTNAEMDNMPPRGNYADYKVHPGVRYSFLTAWSFLHLIEILGFPGFRDSYWMSNPPEGLIPPVFGPHLCGPALLRPRPHADPSCWDYCTGGFFRGHDAVCDGSFPDEASSK